MSAIALSAPLAGRRSPAVGVAALAGSVVASAWLAVGAAGGDYLVQLPTSVHPAWIHGPLSHLGGSLGPAGVSVALAVSTGCYLVALACASAIPLRRALAGVVLANLAFTLGPTLVSTDVFGYVAYAREAAHGLNPYVSAPAAMPHDAILPFVYWKHQTSPYGPLFTVASLPLGLASPVVALWLYKAAAGAASIGLAWLAAVAAPNPTRAALLVGLNPVLLVYAVSGAHNDLLGALLVAAALVLVVRRRDSAGATAAVGALAIKATFGLALPFVVIGARRRRTAVRAAALALVALGVPALLLFGPHLLDQVHRIASGRLFDIAFSGPDRLATLLGTRIDSAIRLACMGAAGAVALAMVVRAWRGGDWITAAGWAFLALIASIASLAPWYLVWLLPFAALSRSRSLRAATLLATVYLIAVHVPALGGQPWLSPSHADALRGPRARVGDERRAAPTATATTRDLLRPGTAENQRRTAPRGSPSSS